MHPRVFSHAHSVFLALAAALPAAGAIHNVQVSNNVFTPASITVAPGDTVHWFRTAGSHTVTSGTGCVHNTPYFNASLNATTTTFDWVVPTGVGSVPYFCIPHCAMGMTGTITIQSTDLQDFIITLDGDQEVPANTSAATGSGTATLDLQTNVLSWNITFSGLQGTQTAAHFHGAALPCVNAGIQVGLPNGSPIIGSAQLTPAQAADLLAGKWYVNVHSNIFPGGEIRGQVMPTGLTDPIPAPLAAGDIYVRLETVATGLTAPNWGVPAPGIAGRLFVSDQNGTVWNIDLESGTKSVFLDVAALLVPLGVFGPNSFDERGLLGLAFDPDYATNGLLYTFTSEPAVGTADFTTLQGGEVPNCHSVVAEWTVDAPTDPDAVVNVGSRRELLRIDKPQFNHNGGGLAFGPDGYLYISLGDGGGADDRNGQPFIGVDIVGHGCGGNGQNINAILGKLIRIDPSGSNSANGQYGIPADNPFVGAAGLDEIWALGFRNPWRFSFDSMTGDLVVPDVGQNDIEEVNLVIGGGNYGWREMEGSFYFVFNGNQSGYVTDVPLAVTPGLIDPVAEYDHDEGTAVVGGFVYNGPDVPELQGRFVFGDFARTFSNDGRLFYLDASNEVKEFNLIGLSGLNHSLLGFGQDADGEVYVLANTTGTPFGTTGVVLRIASGRGDMNCDGVIDFGDINAFVLAISNPGTWQATYPGCPIANGDVNGNGSVGFDDINPFVALLVAQ